MHVRTELKLRDFLAINVLTLPRFGINWLVFGIVWIWVASIAARAEGFSPTPESIAVMVISTTYVALVVFAVLLLVGLVFSLPSISKRSGVLGVHDFWIREDGLMEQTSANETLTRWTAIRKTFRTRRYIYLRINLWLYHVIPRRGFGSAAGYEAFWNALRQHLRAAKLP